jgi:type II secretory pathway pseudopilin PulG
MKNTWVIVIIVLAAFSLCFVAVFGILIAIAVPGFLRAREVSRRNACQENQAKIEAAVMQYVLENRLTAVGHDGGTGFMDLVGNPNQDALNHLVWMSADDPRKGQAILFGETELVRYVSICPAGGYYHLQDPESSTAVSDNVVYCTLRHRPGVQPTFYHVFPGEDPNAVKPLSGQ